MGKRNKAGRNKLSPADWDKVWSIGWDPPRCLPATQESSKLWAPRKLALLVEVAQGYG